MKKYFNNFDEKKLISKSLNLKYSKDKKSIIFQCPLDHFYLHLYSEIIKNEIKNDLNFIGVIEIPINIKKREALLVYPFLLKKISQKLLEYKWKKLYKTIGISKFHLSRKNNFKILKLAYLKYKSIKSNKELNDIHIKNIYCGDLIWDTLIRFSSSKLPVVNYKSITTFITIYRAYQSIFAFNKIILSHDFIKAFIPQTVYIFNGIPLRLFFLKGIKTYASASLECMFKEIKIKNDLGSPYATEYKKIFVNNKFNEKQITLALTQFSSRFKGNDDLGWLNSLERNPYNNLIDEKIEKDLDGLDGIIFLHDFFDGNRFYGKSIFTDFFSWTEFTLNLITNNNLKVGIKPHPFQMSESEKVVDYFKIKYPNLIWLDSKISNNQIFKSNISFGITQHGTVISELAFHNIVPIFCGDCPIDSFNIGFKAKTIDEYEKLIKNFKSLKLNKDLKNELGIYYYMHHIYNKNDYDLSEEISDGVKLLNIKDRFYYDTSDLKLINQ